MPFTEEESNTETALRLPLMVTLNDIRVVIQYLKKMPEGVSIKDATRSVKKQMLGPEKLASYETLGIMTRSDDRLNLSALGRELARRFESETEVFRLVLHSIEPYRGALQWAFHQDPEIIVINDIITYWTNNFPETLGSGNSQTVKAQVVSFFHLCHAAELGIITIGKRGHPDRLHVDRRELRNYIETFVVQPLIEQNFLPQDDNEMRSYNTSSNAHFGSITSKNMAPNPHAPKVYISCRHRDEFVAKIEVALELADIHSVVHIRSEDAGLIVAEDAYEAMHQCNSAIIILSAGDYKEQNEQEHKLKESVMIEIGAAQVLYNRRLVLMRDRSTPSPHYLKDYIQYEYVNNQLTWETGVQLLRTLKDFEP